MVAVIFHRIGPYHFARLREAGRHLPITALETSGTDETYAWDIIGGADGFERVMLFDKADAQRQTKPEVARRVADALAGISPQVVVMPGWADSAALAALQWCSKNKTPAVVMSESTEWDQKRSAWREAVKRRLVGLCSSALTGGRPHRDYMVKLGMSSERVFLGYDSVDNHYFADKVAEVRSQKLEARVKYGLAENYFLASARFIEKKNLPRLIEAYALYREKAEMLKTESLDTGVGNPLNADPIRVPWDLVLLGNGELRPDLNSQLSTLNLHDHVQMPGFKQYADLPVYYGLAGAFIHASTTEQWGLVVNEAMASGLPVLVSNRCGCASDLVQEGVNGFTFDPYNVEEIAQLMFQVSSFQPFRLSAFGAASRSTISHWGPDRFAAGLKTAIQKALEVGPARPTWIQKLILRSMLSR